MPTSNTQQVPVTIVGSSQFGIYPKINIEKTFNMFISDDWLINYAGYQRRLNLGEGIQGRGLYASYRGNFMIAVSGTGVYKISEGLGANFIASIETSTGRVSIAENLSSQICIVDGLNAYIYNYETDEFKKQNLTHNSIPIVPNYVDFHNTYFLFGSSPSSLNPHTWYVASFATATTITIQIQDQFTVSTKPDYALAVLRIPGRGNNVIAIGSTVAEVWTQVDGPQKYRRVSSSNINVGAISIDTIATSDDRVIWLAHNEDESPSIIITDGSSNQIVSTDGISHLMESLIHPEQSTGFIYKQNGHLFYHLTFYHPSDNLSLLYDFNTEKFFHLSDENQNYYPANQTAFFQRKIYFSSLNDNGIYEMSPDFLTYNYSLDDRTTGDIIPRIRVTNTIRKDDASIFRSNQFSFWLEQGVNTFFAGNEDVVSCVGQLIDEDTGALLVTEDGDPMLDEQGYCVINANRPRVDLSFSKDGNQSFSNIVSRNLNSQGKYRNQINWHKFGQANEITFQLRFWGIQRFIAKDAVLETY